MGITGFGTLRPRPVRCVRAGSRHRWGVTLPAGRSLRLGEPDRVGAGREPQLAGCVVLRGLYVHGGTIAQHDSQAREDRASARGHRSTSPQARGAGPGDGSSVGSQVPCRPGGTRTGMQTCATGPDAGSSAGMTRNQLVPSVRSVAKVSQCPSRRAVLCGREHRFPDGQIAGLPQLVAPALDVVPARGVVFAGKQVPCARPRRRGRPPVMVPDEPVVDPRQLDGGVVELAGPRSRRAARLSRSATSAWPERPMPVRRRRGFGGRDATCGSGERSRGPLSRLR